MQKLREDALEAEREMIENSMKKTVTAEKPGALDSLSERLQSENPFDEFKKFLDEALKKQEEEAEQEEINKNSEEDGIKEAT